MTRNMQIKKSPYRLFLTAGLLGGLAEIAWMYAYNLNNTIGLKEISREISATLHISSSNYAIGLIIHLSLSLLIGLGYGKIILEKYCKNNLGAILMSSLLVLAVIWVSTFKLILPILNNDMANIVPMHISFISKMLFGLFMALSYHGLNRQKTHL